MGYLSKQGEFIRKIEVVTVSALQVLAILLVAVATVILYILFYQGLRTQAAHIESVGGLLFVMQKAFAGILTVVLGLELLETLKAYFAEHHVRLEVILVVAIIAVGRHVLEVDFDHTTGVELLGLSGVILSLSLGYFLVKRTQVAQIPGGAGGDTHDDPNGSIQAARP
ncbi:MAG TPA: phosphate-starvation-inducible PsiE family protein [Bryobacteraceae bacterium]|nr:phosphate-starvation-inducible PsiE family protein [Bryobacteraceae bacterium]